MELNKSFWTWFNFFVSVLSIVLAVGCWYVQKINHESGTSCGGLKGTIWITFFMHIVNSVIGIINLTPLYKCFWNLLPSTVALGLILYEIGMLMFMQFTYFEAQNASCMSTAPDLYFWMMAMIFIQYVALGVVLCYFVRKIDIDDTDNYTPL